MCYILKSGFVQETRHKYQGLSSTKCNVFQDHSFLIDSDFNRLSQNWEWRKHSTLNFIKKIHCNLN